jgi:signal transduction histidine kinase
LSLSPRDSREFDTLVAQQKVLHVCIAGIVVVSTSILALVISRAFRRQLRLAGLKNDLVSTVSHELKTPLASMRLLVDTLLDTEHLNGEQTREYLQLIAKENERLSRLIENFLTFSRLERGKHAFVFAAVSVQQLVARSIEAAGERFQRLDCALTSDIAPDLPLVRGDADALVRVLLNLLDNAYKYSRGDRQICVRARADGDRVRLSVSDHGVGMSRAAARRVLQKFFQVDQSLVREGHGCGLGLSIVEYIVRAHGGTITVESRADEGSTFTVTLPTVSAAERNHRDS